MAMPGRPLLTLYDPAALRVSVAVPQIFGGPRRSRTARPGWICPVTAQVASRRDAQVLPTVDPATHTLELRLDLPAGLPGVAPGMFARAWLPLAGSAEPRLFVPARAIVRRAELSGVYVVGAMACRLLRQVRLGRPQATRSRCWRACRPASASRSIRRRRAALLRRDDDATRLGISGRIAAFFQAARITPLLALVALLLGAFAVLVDAARGGAADRRDDGQRAGALPGRLGARRRADGRHARRAGAVADRRGRARDVGLATGAGRDHGAVQGRPCRAPRRWCASTTPSTRTPTGCRRGLGVGDPLIKPQGHRRRADRDADAVRQDRDERRLRPGARRPQRRGRPQARARHARGRDGRRPGPRGADRDRPGTPGGRRRHRRRPAQRVAVRQPGPAARRAARRQPIGRARGRAVPARRPRHRRARRWACTPAGRCSCRTSPTSATARCPRNAMCGTAWPGPGAASTRPSRSRSPRSRARTPSTWPRP